MNAAIVNALDATLGKLRPEMSTVVARSRAFYLGDMLVHPDSKFTVVGNPLFANMKMLSGIEVRAPVDPGVSCNVVSEDFLNTYK